jgi:pimeloyl-ACP methyl ester carboxylesterase
MPGALPEKFAVAIRSTPVSLLGPSTRTKPILDAQGRTVSGSIATLEPLTLGGVRQWLLVRGRSADSPLLLKLHGGPGQAEMATVRLNGLLEADFVVIEWDQRGSGKSAASIQAAAAMNLGQLVADTIELTENLTQRFGKRQLIIAGHSWGSVLGLMAVQRRPDLYSAFISTGLMANFAEGQRVAYRFLLAESERRGAGKALADLTGLGAPPYAGADGSSKWKRCARWLGEFGAVWHSSEKFDRVGWMLSSIEYSWPEKLRFSRAAARSYDLLYADLLSVNLIESVRQVEVPVFFAEGRYDQMAPVEVAERYFSGLIAPAKEWVLFENSAHFPHWEERERFHELLVNTVLPAAGS